MWFNVMSLLTPWVSALPAAMATVLRGETPLLRFFPICLVKCPNF
jgi:hypothetical protein